MRGSIPAAIASSLSSPSSSSLLTKEETNRRRPGEFGQKDSFDMARYKAHKWATSSLSMLSFSSSSLFWFIEVVVADLLFSYTSSNLPMISRIYNERRTYPSRDVSRRVVMTLPSMRGNTRANDDTSFSHHVVPPAVVSSFSFVLLFVVSLSCLRRCFAHASSSFTRAELVVVVGVLDDDIVTPIGNCSPTYLPTLLTLERRRTLLPQPEALKRH